MTRANRMTIRSGPWDARRIGAFCESATIPIRLATVGSDGTPLVQSLWFAPWIGSDGGDRIWCATQSDAVLVARLRRDGRVAFEIGGDDMPYRGVRGTGTARIDGSRGGEILRTLLARYDVAIDGALGAWLLSRVDTEVAVAIGDLEVTSWDFSKRMGDGDAPR